MVLEVTELVKEFPVEQGIFLRHKGMVRALDRVSFSVAEKECVGIVGESGSGKTTLAKIILGLSAPTSGTVRFDPRYLTRFRKEVQIIFQNPYNSLNPLMRVAAIISEPLVIHSLCAPRESRQRAIQLLEMVGLDQSALTRYPSEFSGGQRQRICIARALACEPRLLVLDEPLSSLDLTIQAQMLDLFQKLQEEFSLTYIFISHNLAVMKQIAQRLIVLSQGRIVEQGSTSGIFEHPEHPYTRALLNAAHGTFPMAA